MLTIYLILLAVKMTATLGASLTSFLVSRKRIAPTGTYVLFSIAFLLAFVNQILSIIKTGNVVDVVFNNPGQEVLTQLMAASYFMLFFVGYIRKLAALKALGFKD